MSKYICLTIAARMAFFFCICYKRFDPLQPFAVARIVKELDIFDNNLVKKKKKKKKNLLYYDTIKEYQYSVYDIKDWF